MAYSKQRLERIMDLIEQKVDHTRDALDEAYGGPPLGATSITDDEFRFFFEQKVAENPNWPLALPFVDGGKQLIARYERVTGLRNG